MHPSGIVKIRDYLVSEELEGNMAGRCGRESDGLATFIRVPVSASGQERLLLDSSEKDSEDLLQHLDQYWELLNWRDSIRDPGLRASLPDVPEAAFHLVKWRYADVPRSSLAMCPRLAYFVEEAKKEGVGMEALRLACIMERAAGTFNPQEVFLKEEGPHAECPLLALARILQDVQRYITHYKSVAKQRGKPLMDLKIFPRRLLKARGLYWKSDPESRLRPSALDEAAQSEILVRVLARAMPEFIGRQANGNWYCSGYRVRGASLPSRSPS